jgi:threonylcarbamoyladenosine tRNA methylthiotransferase MtaB
MRTFFIQTLGCRVNHYEAAQMAASLRRRGLVEAPDASSADLRIVHTCSVTGEAAAKSRQAVRRAVRGRALPVGEEAQVEISRPQARTVVTGCWAVSNRTDASSIDGVAAVIGHGEDLARGLHALIDAHNPVTPPTGSSFALPLLGDARAAHQRAFLKVQDGCDAHCTYCIIPKLRPTLWSKPVDECVEEARRLVEAGHREVVLTGIFLGAFGQGTALRRRQLKESNHLVALLAALCTRVPGLLRLRLSSLEPGDMTPELVRVMSDHRQVVPHFHLPLQSGSDRILRRMNRQYRRDDFLRMIDCVRAAFDRPAFTTDIIVAFPGESEHDFGQTLDLVDRVGFIHVHAFGFSPRPGTAAARWIERAVAPAVASQRIAMLVERATRNSLEFRRQFIGKTVQILVERPKHPTLRFGRCERYFEVEVDDAGLRAGDVATVAIEAVETGRTVGRPTGRQR